jgi:hypothetical protein
VKSENFIVNIALSDVSILKISALYTVSFSQEDPLKNELLIKIGVFRNVDLSRNGIV